jgi:hypothetical protein
MYQDDKIGIGYGMLCPMALDQHGRFDGKVFTVDKAGLDLELETAAEAGANFIRCLPDLTGVWGQHPGGKKSQFQPHVLNTKQTAWILGKYNTYFFPIQDYIFARANNFGLTVLYDLFENCQFHGGYRVWTPWYSNEQGVTSFYGKDADPYSKPWVSTMMVRAARRDVILGFGNELENQAAPDFVERVIFPYIKSQKWPLGRMTLGATAKIVGAGDSIQDTIRKKVRDTFGLVAEKDVIQEDHGWPFTATLPLWGPKPYRKCYSNDGTYFDPKHPSASKCDISGIGKGARPSAAAQGALAKMILTKYPASLGGRARLISFEHLPAGFGTGSLECKVAPIEAISASYRARFGVWPSNYGKHS